VSAEVAVLGTEPVRAPVPGLAPGRLEVQGLFQGWQIAVLDLLIGSWSIRPATVQACMRLTPAGIKNRYRVTRRFLNWLEERGLIHVPAQHCPTCRCGNKVFIIDILDREGLSRLRRNGAGRALSAIYRTGHVADHTGVT
jgi:hypothetical protein